MFVFNKNKKTTTFDSLTLTTICLFICAFLLVCANIVKITKEKEQKENPPRYFIAAEEKDYAIIINLKNNSVYRVNKKEDRVIEVETLYTKEETVNISEIIDAFINRKDR